MKIKDLPVNELPRERFVLYGKENLSNSDLISIVLRTGIKNKSVREISDNILSYVGDINNLNNINMKELSNIKGVGDIKAITLLAAVELGKRVSTQSVSIKMTLNNSYKVHETFKKIFINEKQEKFLAIYLDNKKKLITYKTLFIGTLNYSVVHPREIFNEALKCNAASIICIHNHPSNDITPSKEDIELTNKIIESGKIIGIPLIDHLITNGEEYYSFYETNNKV